MALLTVGAAMAQEAGTETVVVTGYRASLEKAIDLKRSATDSSDSILAEDIGKFPDMNVSEALQRIPGVALNRESGEGREITVRGLGAQFTRVRVNGIEAIATIGSQDVSTSNPGASAGGTNRGRAFDFNVFASELFTKLTVHKTTSASVEEGSLGATVDMQTARPFDHPGFVFTTSAQAQYQELSGSVTPRVAALISDTFANGHLGALFSVAYQGTNTLEEGTSSVRWMSDYNNTASRSGSYLFGAIPSGTNNTTAEANTAFRPRFPRYDIVGLHGKRLGLTSSLQWQPDEGTLFTVDGLYADFAQVRTESYLEANSFSTSGYGAATQFINTATSTNSYVVSQGVQSINLRSYTLGGPTGLDANHVATQTMLAATATNVGLRNEHRLDHLDTRFMQLTVDGSHDFTNNLKSHVLLGWTESHHRNPIQTTVATDLGCIGTGTAPKAAAGAYNCGAGTVASPYSFDYSKGDMPMLNTGNIDPTSSAGWFLANVRERQQYAFNSYRSAAFDLEYNVAPELTLSGGFDYRNYGFNTYELRRSSGGSGEDSTIPAAIRSVPLSSYVTTVKLKGVDVPAGSNSSWFVTDFEKAAKAISLWDTSVFPMNRAPGTANSGTVHENDYGAWVQAAWDTDIAGLGFRGDVGVRYVLTEANTNGVTYATTGLVPVSAHNIYHDWLPALNAVLEPAEDFLIRFNASMAMTRPTQSSFIPSGAPSVSGSSFTANVGNAHLPAMRSKNLDLSFEYYYGKGSMISVAGFWKHLDNFFQQSQSSGIWSANPFGFGADPFIAACGGSGSDWNTIPTSSNCYNLKANQTWTFSQTVSVKGAPLYGTEINWQQQFDFLPHPFDSFGLLANYTYVQAQQSYYTAAGVFLMKADLNNMSRNSYNATIYYDDSIFQARATASFRSHYLIDPNIQSNYQNFGIFVKSTFNLDASASYKVDENLMFTVDALNLTNQASNIYADAFAKRSYQYHETGSVYFVGAKYTY
jgi:TonB-dependent receptor